MLKSFIIRVPKKTTPRNYSFYTMMGVTLTEDVIRVNRFNNLLHSSWNRFSSSTATEMAISSRKERLKKAVKSANVKPMIDIECNNRIHKTSHNVFDIKDYVLPDGEKNILKEENLELFQEIANGDDEKFELLKQLQKRIDITACKYGVKVHLKKEDWLDLVNSSLSKRGGHVACLIVNTLRDLKKQYLNPPQLYDFTEFEDVDANSSYFDDVRCYHLFHNSMFLKLRQSAVRKIYYAKGFTAMLYSSAFVFDCSYDEYMNIHELKQLGKQLVASISLNIRSEHPFHTMLCNFNYNSRLAEIILKLNPIMFTDDYPVTVTEKSFLNFFPKEKIIYLTPHCPKTLKKFDSDKVYIVGAFVDKTQKKPFSLAKGKEMGLEMAKFPIDEYLNWGMGNKSLPLPHVTKIMHDLKISNNWNKAFDIIPQRCLTKPKSKSSLKNTFENEIRGLYDSVTFDS